MNKFGLIKKLIPFFWSNGTRNRMLIIISILCTFLAVILNIGVPLILRSIVNSLSDDQKVISFTLFVWISAYALLWTFAQIVINLRTMSLLWPIARGLKKLCISVFKQLLSLSLSYHLERETGGLLILLERAQNAFPRLINAFLWQILPLFFEVIIAVYLVAKLYNIYYALVLLVTIALYLFSTIISVKQTLAAQNQKLSQLQRLSSYFLDVLVNIETIKAFNNEQYELYNCENIATKKEIIVTKSDMRMLKINIVQMLIVGIGLTLVVLRAGYDISQGLMSVGDFILLNSYLLQFSLPMSYFGYVAMGIKQDLVDLSNLIKILDLKPEIVDTDSAEKLESSSAAVIFDNVTFSYDNRHAVLKNLSFVVPYGKTFAIVGASGSGKSTIIKLILRFFDPINGNILIGRQNIKNVTQTSLHQALGVVAQDTALFNRSLYENIIFGNPTASKQDVYGAINDAQLENLIKSLPLGDQTIIGERGLKLSGGERQRIGIARILLKKPKIYLFDEATSSLDFTTERQIQASIKQVSKGSTTLIIAHRLSTIVDADEILVLNEGELCEQGTHNTLLKKGGIYAKLWNQQLKLTI